MRVETMSKKEKGEILINEKWGQSWSHNHYCECQ
jgi:hypothetical protein